MTLSFLTNTVLRSNTKINMKTTQLIPAMTSTQLSTNVATKKNTGIPKRRRGLHRQ